MKQYLRSRVAKISSYVEIYLSVLIVLAIILVSFTLINDLVAGLSAFINNKEAFDFKNYLSLALKLIIAIEFVKMLAKHTAESTIEVLLFAVARKVILVDTEIKYHEVILGILAIAMLFAIKRFLYTPNLSDPSGSVLEPDTPVQEANRIANVKIPSIYGKTLKEIIQKEFKRLNKDIEEGAYIIVDSAKLKIYDMQNGEITKIEVIPIKDPSYKKFFVK